MWSKVLAISGVASKEEGYAEEVELIEAVRDRLRRSGGPRQREIDEWIAGVGLEAA